MNWSESAIYDLFRPSLTERVIDRNPWPAATPRSDEQGSKHKTTSCFATPIFPPNRRRSLRDSRCHRPIAESMMISASVRHSSKGRV